MPVSPDDYEAILQLVARYNFAADFGDHEGWAACFTEDGAFEASPHDVPLGGRIVGRDELERYAARRFELAGGVSRHFNWNVLVDGDEAGVDLRCYLVVFKATQAEAPAELSITGIHRDRLVKQDGAWLFAQRHVHFDPQEIGQDAHG